MQKQMETRDRGAGDSNADDELVVRMPPSPVFAYALCDQDEDFTNYRSLDLGRFSQSVEAYEFCEDVLGEGRYGLVRKAYFDTGNRELVTAVKQLKMVSVEYALSTGGTATPDNGHTRDNAIDGNPAHDIKKEIKILLNLRGCAHIIQLIDVIVLRGEVSSLTFEHVYHTPHTQLFPTLSIDDVRIYMHQLLSGLHACHSRGIIHADLKPQNLVIDRKTRQLKIIDFGEARFYWPNQCFSPHLGTVGYRPPEVLFKSRHFHYAIDVWAAGCIFMQMLVPSCEPCWRSKSNSEQIMKLSAHFGSHALREFCEHYQLRCYALPQQKPSSWQVFIATYQQPSQQQQYKKQLSPAPAPSPHPLVAREKNLLSAVALDLLDKLLCLDPQQRISCQDALQHPFFTSGA